jgi:hypothetical protein
MSQVEPRNIRKGESSRMRRHRIALLGAVAALLVALVPASSFAASCTTQYVGENAYTSCNDGTQYTTQFVGQFAYTSGSDPYGGTYSSSTQYVGSNAYTSGSGWQYPYYPNTSGY